MVRQGTYTKFHAKVTSTEKGQYLRRILRKEKRIGGDRIGLSGKLAGLFY